MMMGFGFFGLLLMLLFWGLLIVGAVWLAKLVLTGGSNAGFSVEGSRLSAREILDQRYVKKGELTREMYQLMGEDVL